MNMRKRVLSVLAALALLCMAVPVSATELPTEDGAADTVAVIGDVNGDGKVNTTDARLVLQHAVGKMQLDEVEQEMADVNGDGAVDTTDARLVLQFAVGLLEAFPGQGQKPSNDLESGVSAEGWKYIIRKSDGVAIIDGYQGTAAEVTIPDCIKEYPVVGINTAWRSQTLTTVYLGKNMRYVDYSAFGDCKNLAKVIFNDGLERIDVEAFIDCESLKTVCIPDSVTKIGRNVFSNCTDLTSVIIGDGVSEISNGAFASCANLSQVILGENLKTIDEYAFGFCPSLKTIVIPASVTSIASNAFYTYGAALESIYFAGDCPDKFTGLVLDGRQKLPVLYCPRGNTSWDALEQRGAMGIADIVRYDP